MKHCAPIARGAVVSRTLLIVLLLGTSLCADDIGLALGEKAPGFKLKNQSGKEVRLADLLKKSHVALVFYRSADW